ncbi:ornithine carbamoyltransferase [Algimonas porphyrae]|uniref:Ornithine carbamoyltransferase n=1 Tax=Algimonas porphyrae TaxID=1128113 RepID=A0ABQ5V5L9_9PROT|nr:ornithine carbamoyltransferase [Algimonas porphyrae]GLQ21562.1 ornithine carbamoyltransferase [Algimonas porphyrae]
MNHFLSLADLSPVQLRTILDDAHRRKAARAGRPKGAADDDASLSGHTLAMVFEKSSTRTRFSFEQAMRQLGGSAIVATSDQMQLGRGEPVKDTARVLSRYVDAVMLRVNSHDTLTEFARHASVPIINGLSDYNHPCQIIADLMTLEERGLTLKGAKLAWIGDGNNVAMSFVNCAAQLGFSLIVASPDGYRLKGQHIERARAAGADIHLTDHPDAAADGADALITDCFVSMGDTDYDARVAALSSFNLDAARVAKAKPEAVVLHCLPAYRGQEITDAVMEGPQSAIWDEAENRLHAQKSILSWCLRP